MRNVVLTLFVLCFGTNAWCQTPNVLFIAIDDLRPELGCYGTPIIKTPNIDRLAERGTLFNRAYCQVAVCNPSRASLMTGLRPDTLKVWDLTVNFRTPSPDAVTIPQHFRKHGYHAVSYGKVFHAKWPDQISWSEPHEFPEAGTWSKSQYEERNVFREQMRKDGKSDRAISRMRPMAVATRDEADVDCRDGAIGQQGIDALNRLSKEPSKPFFLAVGFQRPHLPFVAPRKYFDMYDPQTIPLATNQFLPKNAPPFAMNTMYELRYHMDFSEVPKPTEGSVSVEDQRRLKHGYYASVTYVDVWIGKILDELDRLKLTDNTIIVLWGDHGWKLGEHNSWCKQTNYEIDTRTPIIISTPKQKVKGSKTDGLVEFIDIYPTLCDLAGLPIPDVLEGKSLAPLLDAPQTKWDAPALSQYIRRDGDVTCMGYAMRTDRYRYIQWRNRATGEVHARELYDHDSDPQENENIAANADHAALLTQYDQVILNRFPTAGVPYVKDME